MDATRKLLLQKALRHPIRFLYYLWWRWSKSARIAKRDGLELFELDSIIWDLDYFGTPQSIGLHVGLADLACERRFNLLGSGWTEIKHGLQARGLEGHRFPAQPEIFADAEGNWLEPRLSDQVAEAQATWRLLKPGYSPIDWQIDFKSGFRWSERKPSSQIEFAKYSGQDIKCPWELARFYHAAHFAVAFTERRDERYWQSFRSQTLDFISQNPVGFGVNWVSSMEVAIRAINWIAAYDVFVSQAAPIDNEFKKIFTQSLAAHARHIFEHLEWHPFFRGNHYLANIVGLLIIAQRLKSNPATDQWLKFATRELSAETQFQFHAEGSCFEASTSYHRLSAELVALATAVASQARVKARFSPKHWTRLLGMALFTLDISNSRGATWQVGDNDSGRVLKFDMAYEGEIENEADHRPLVGLLNGFFENATLKAFAGTHWVLYRWVRGLTCQPSPVTRQVVTQQRASISWPIFLKKHKAQSGLELELKFPQPLDLGSLHRIGYPQFGIYGWKNSNFSLIIRCGPVGQNGFGAHAHNDQLSLMLEVNGQNWISDPGSYIYTPLPERRNQYRSTMAHFTPQAEGREQSPLTHTFFLEDRARAKCLLFDDFHFVGSHRGFGAPVYRGLELTAGSLILRDFTSGSFQISWPTHKIQSGTFEFVTPPYSRGYGQPYYWDRVTG